MVIVLIAFTALMLIGCNNKDDIDFNATIPTDIEVGQTFTVSAKDLEDNQIDASKLSVVIKSGNTLVTLDGLSVTGVAVGSVTITVTYEEDDLSANKDYTFNVVASSVTFGLPTPQTGYYMKDAALIQEADGTRILVYVSNASSGEEE